MTSWHDTWYGMLVLEHFLQVQVNILKISNILLNGFQSQHHIDWPGRGTEARLVTSVCLIACRRRCRACVRSSSWPSSASRRSLALNISAMCFCRMVFCSSNSTLAFRSRLSSASRAVKKKKKTFCTKTYFLPVANWQLFYMMMLVPLFWSRNSSVKMGTSNLLERSELWRTEFFK